MTVSMSGSGLRACWGPLPEHEQQRHVPFLDVLRRQRAGAPASFACPGHKMGAGVDPALVDLLGAGVFAGDIWLARADYGRALEEAETLAARAWGAGRAFFLVNGSSSGNQALFLASLTPADEVVIGRDIHASMLAGLILSGARPVYVTPRFHPESGVSLGIAPDDVAAALERAPAARLVALASPNYYGIAADVPGIVAAAHARDVPVYVDEAWGPHFPFHPELPPSAMQSGADAAVTSIHKLLAGLSQGSMLLLAGQRLDTDRIAAAVAMTQTTSPLLPILASLDSARRQMALDGEVLVGRALHLARRARRALGRLPGIELLDGEALGLERHDPTRLVIDVHRLGLTGYVAESILRERLGIAPEMSDQRSVVCLLTIGDTEASIARLVGAFRCLAAGREVRSGDEHPGCRALGEVISAGAQSFTPREAYFAPSRQVPLASAAGEVSAEPIVPYPPGVPVLMPGELISGTKVDYLRDQLARGMSVRGASDSSLASVRVVA